MPAVESPSPATGIFADTMATRLTKRTPVNFLVVDNDHSVAKIIRSMLLREFVNSSVTITGSLQDAWDIYCERKIDFVISEIDHPTGSGLDFLAEIRVQDKNIPFIYISRRNDRELIILAAQNESDGYVVKPFSENALIDSIREAWKKRKSEYTQILNQMEDLASKDPTRALDQLEDKFGSNEQTARMFTLRWRIFQRLKRFEEAKESLSHAINVNPMFLTAKKNLADVMMETGEKDKAKTLYEEVVDISPMYKECHVSLAKVYAEDQEFGKLKQLTDHYSTYFPKSTDLQMIVAEELLRNGQNEMAAELFKKIIDIDKQAENFDTDSMVYRYNRLGIALRREGKVEEAIAYYLEALDLAPNNAAVHYNLGVACGQCGQHKRAIQEFQTALNLDPSLEEARREMEKVLQIVRERVTVTME